MNSSEFVGVQTTAALTWQAVADEGHRGALTQAAPRRRGTRPGGSARG
jgi:hypothetical protein